MMQAAPVLVGNWATDEDFPVYPVGSKPKRMLRCPVGAPLTELIPKHAYLFKIARGWRSHQMWSEFIAYQLAALVQLNVPRCFIAFDEQRNEHGVLVEFFFGHPGHNAARFVHGTDILNLLGKQATADRPHSVRTNVRVCRRLLRIESAPVWWGRALTFDALIGNTDRHPENWGFLSKDNANELAPVFDNGTSLGYEIQDHRLEDLRSASAMASYLAKGTHHCGWEDADGGSINHTTLCGRFATQFPATKESMLAVLSLRIDDVVAMLEQCVQLDVDPAFTQQRLEWIVGQIAARKASLEAALGA